MYTSLQNPVKPPELDLKQLKYLAELRSHPGFQLLLDFLEGTYHTINDQLYLNQFKQYDRDFFNEVRGFRRLLVLLKNGPDQALTEIRQRFLDEGKQQLTFAEIMELGIDSVDSLTQEDRF